MSARSGSLAVGALVLGCSSGKPPCCEQPSTTTDLPSAAATAHDNAATSDAPHDNTAQTDGADGTRSPDTTTPSHVSTRPRFVELEVAGRPNPVVWEPQPSAEALPLIVVAHGAGGGPEWHCDFWSRVIEDSAFLLCLRGKPLGGDYGGHFFPEHHTLERMFSASVAAVDERYQERILATDSIYIGYSQGATMGALMLAAHAKRFSRLLLIEGGYGQWNVQRALEFKRAGGLAVFFACGTKTCDREAHNSVTWFERAGSRARTETAPGEGHTPAGRVADEAVEGLAWLLDQHG